MSDVSVEATALSKDKRSSKASVHRYTLNVSERLYDRVDRTLREARKEPGTRLDKSGWIIESIRRKLSRDHHEIARKGILRMKSIQVSLPEDLAQELQEKIAQSRRLTGKGSLKTWIVDAIEERLASD